MRFTSTIVSFATAALLLSAPAAAFADDEYTQAPDVEGLAIAVDLLLARPLGLVATIVGATIFTIGLPIELMAGDVATPAQRLVADPARYTFQRPLGLIDPMHPGM
jgi:hypothetical protein